MNYAELSDKFSVSTEKQQKAIFSTLFIAANRLQTLFDSHIPELSLKQFMLLSLVRQAEHPLTLTKLGELLGCSRQNVKKLAAVLKKKGFIELQPGPADPRAICIQPTQKAEDFYANEFARYQEELKYLFEVYSPEETATLFRLLSRLYEGIDNLEKKTGAKSTAEGER